MGKYYLGERSPGKVVAPLAGGYRLYFKPSLGKPTPIVRTAGVMRKSENVIRINEQLAALRGAGNHPARVCKGRKWKEFVKCLRDEMKKAIKPVGAAR